MSIISKVRTAPFHLIPPVFRTLLLVYENSRERKFLIFLRKSLVLASARAHSGAVPVTSPLQTLYPKSSIHFCYDDTQIANFVLQFSAAFCDAKSRSITEDAAKKANSKSGNKIRKIQTKFAKLF